MVRESLHRPRLTDDDSEIEKDQRSISPSSNAAKKLESSATSSQSGDEATLLHESGNDYTVDQGTLTLSSFRRPSLDEEIQSTIDELKCNSQSMRRCSKRVTPASNVSSHGGSGSSSSDTGSASTLTIKQVPSLFSGEEVKGRTTGSISVNPSTLSLPALAVPIVTPKARLRTTSFASTRHLGSVHQRHSSVSPTLSKSLNGRKGLVGADEEENLVNKAVQEEKFSGRMKSEEMAVLQMLDQMSFSTDSSQRSHQPLSSTLAAFPRPKPARSTPKKVVSAFPLPTSPSRMSVKAVAEAVNHGGRQSPFQSPSRKHLSVDAVHLEGIGEGGRSSRPGGVREAIMEREKLDQSRCASPISEMHNEIVGSSDPTPESYAGIGTYMARFSHRANSVSPTRLSSSPKRQVFQRQESEASMNTSYASQTNAFLNRRPTHAADKRLTHSPKSSLLFSSADESTSFYWSRRKGAHDSPETDATTPGLSSESDFGPSRKLLCNPQKLLVSQIEAGTGENVGSQGASTDLVNETCTAEHQSEKIDMPQDTIEVKSSIATTQPPSKLIALTSDPPVNCRTTVVAASSFLSGSQSLPSSLNMKKASIQQSPSKLSTPSRAKDLIRLYESNNKVESAPLTPTKPGPASSIRPFAHHRLISNDKEQAKVDSPYVGPPVPTKQLSQNLDVGIVKVTPRKAVNYTLLGNAARKVGSNLISSTAATSRSIAARSIQGSPSPSKSSLPYLLPTPNPNAQLDQDGDDFGPPSPPSDVQFSWPSDADVELLPADSASQRVARTPTMSSHFTAVPQRHSLREPRVTNASVTKTPAQKLRDDVVSDLKLGFHHDDAALSTVEESIVADQFSTPLTNSYGDQMMPVAVTSTSPQESAQSVDQDVKAATSNTSSQDVALVLRFLEKQQQEREQREAFLDDQLRSFQDTLSMLKTSVTKETPPPVEKEMSNHDGARTSQAIQTPVMGDAITRNADLATVLAAIKDNERAREAQQKQQHEIARYLNDLNSWLEKDVVDRTNEWKTLAMGVTKLHEEINEIKSGQAINATRNLEGVSTILAHPDGAVPTAFEAVGPSESRMMQVDETQPDALVGQHNRLSSLQEQMMAAGVEAPAPIVTPGPSPTFKRSGTRTWRAEAAPGAMRNNDVWAGGPIKSKDKKSREEKKADGRARRRSAFTDSSVGRIALAAGGAALLRAAQHEYERYKERQRSEGKPEDSSSSIDEKTGKYEKHDEVPEAHIDKMKEAIIKGDEDKVREAVKGAAEVGAGAAAIHKLMGWIKGGADEEEQDADINAARRSDAKSDDSQKTTRSAKSSAEAGDDDASKTLRDAVESMSSIGGGGAALALAVEEILKHLLEKKEEEKRLAKEEAEAEAAREAKRKQEEEEKEKKMMAIREQEKRELVETILSKLQQEKARQEQETLQKQQELDPKSAIESLVVAINQQRAMDAAQHANADAAIKQLASEVVRTSTESSGQLVEAVHSAAREMLRQNIESHAEELKSALTKEVSTMFEDVGKIRETKRSLEQEIADLFLIKSKHLSDVAAAAPAPAPQDPSSSEVGARAATPTGAPLFPAIGNMFRPPTTVPISRPLPHPQPPAQWCPPSLQPAHQNGSSSHPPLNPQELQMLNQAKFAAPNSASISQPKRDLIGPLSINFGPRRK